ncbi:MAG: hypothetical protein GX896_00335 [Clostridiales bacterium]|nr:hypothetical protein [Clostridiales bacterium]
MLAGALACSVLSGCSKDDSSSSKNNSSNNQNLNADGVIMNKENVKLAGRTTLIEDTLWFGLSGAGVEFEFTGKKLDMTIVGDGAAFGDANNQARFAIYVDGERVIDKMLDEEEMVVTPVDNAESKTVTVKVIKLSETAMSTMGIKPIKLQEGEKITPVAQKELKIEFIGDSITCGYGVDDEVKENHFATTTEDVTKTYAYKTAQALDADYSMFSISGYGIISGYSSNGKKVPEQALPQYYGKLGYSWNKFAEVSAPNEVDWDFSNYQPNIIVINLGTNDSTYCKGDEKKQEYVDAYKEFLKQVREANPNAEIFCTLGIMGANLYSSVEEVCYNYTEETGDSKVHPFKFDTQDGTLGYAADWHPTEATHEKSSQSLVEFIKETMGL